VNYRNETVLLFGGSGFIGEWVGRALAQEGAIVHPMRKPYIDDFNIIGSAINQLKPTHIFNLAGYGVSPGKPDEQLAQRLNAELPAYLAANAAGARLIHVGSSAEYGTTDKDLTEETPCRPDNWYGRSKLAGTEAAAGYANGIVARLFNVYGPGEANWRLVPSLLAAARSGEPIRLTPGTQQRDFTFVADAAEGLLRLGLAPVQHNRIVNLASGTTTAVREFVNTAARIFGIPPANLLFGEAGPRGVDLSYGTVSTARLRELTNWRPPTNVEAGLKACLTFPAHETMKGHG
jgi:nucleoside-diphosphate-sugar epimerase